MSSERIHVEWWRTALAELRSGLLVYGGDPKAAQMQSDIGGIVLDEVEEKLSALPAQPVPQHVADALKFYAENWQTNGDGDPETPGLSQSWQEPNDALLQDEGRKAKAALDLLARRP